MKNSNKKILSLVLFCCIGFLSISASARIIKVTSAGDGIQANDSSDITLRKALEISKSGDVIKLELSNQKPIIIYYPIDIIEDVTIEGNGDTIKIQPINPTIDPPRVFNVFAKLTLKDATLIGGNVSNVPDDSGGVIKIYSGGSLNAERTTIENGKAVNGGGIYCEANSSLDLLNSTIGGNTAESGGGIYFAGSNGTAILNAVTIAGNTATSTNGNQFYLKDGTLSISNTILASFGKTMTGSDYYLEGGAIADLGFNIIRTSAYYDWTAYGDCIGSDSSEQYIQVGTMVSGMLNLASDIIDNGGKTPTYEISASDSIAVSIHEENIPTEELTALDKRVNDCFGAKTVLSDDGNTALVTAPLSDSYKGKVYIYIWKKWNWELQQIFEGKLRKDSFGSSVSLSADGNTAVIGAYGTDSDKGTIYIYTRSGETWTLQQEITSPGESGGKFGYSVSLSSDGNTSLIGAVGGGMKMGTAYIYTKTEGLWNLTQSIVDPGASGENWFAENICLSDNGSTALIGAYGTESNRGILYMYTKTGMSWELKQTIADPGNAEYDYFGISACLTGDGKTAVIGAAGNDSYEGIVYVYMINGSEWILQDTLSDTGRKTNYDQFGKGISFSSDGNVLLISAMVGGDSETGVYLYKKNDDIWELEKIFSDPEKDGNSKYGAATDLSGNGKRAIIGAYGSFLRHGEAYVYSTIPSYNGLPSNDQRGYKRTDESVRTIGAYDYSAVPSANKRKNIKNNIRGL